MQLPRDEALAEARPIRLFLLILFFRFYPVCWTPCALCSWRVTKPALRTIGNIVCAEDDTDYTQHIIDAGAVPCLQQLIAHSNREIQKEVRSWSSRILVFCCGVGGVYGSRCLLLLLGVHSSYRFLVPCGAGGILCVCSVIYCWFWLSIRVAMVHKCRVSSVSPRCPAPQKFVDMIVSPSLSLPIVLSLVCTNGRLHAHARGVMPCHVTPRQGLLDPQQHRGWHGGADPDRPRQRRPPVPRGTSFLSVLGPSRSVNQLL